MGDGGGEVSKDARLLLRGHLQCLLNFLNNMGDVRIRFTQDEIRVRVEVNKERSFGRDSHRKVDFLRCETSSLIVNGGWRVANNSAIT